MLNVRDSLIIIFVMLIGISLFCIHADNVQAAAFTDYKVNDNFNKTTTGNAPAGWITDTSGGTVTVQEVPSASNKSVKINKAATTNAALGLKTFTALSGVVTVEMRVKTDETTGFKCIPYITDGTNPAVALIFENGYIKAYNGPSTIDSIQAFTANTWYNFRVVLNTDTDKYDLYLNGERVKDQAGFRNAVTNVQKLQFGLGSGITGTLYYDNVIVYQSADSTVSYSVEENFNNNALGSTPRGWIANNAGGIVGVVAVPSSDNRSLKMYNSSTANTTLMTKNFTSLSGNVIVQANIRSDETVGRKNALYLMDSNAAEAVCISFSNGSIDAYNGTALTKLQSFAAGSWYTIRAVIDTSTGKYDLYIDGCQVLKSADLKNNVAEIANAVFGVGSGNTGTLYLDNLLVYVSTAILPTQNVYNVKTSYGARGDGVTNDTVSIQNAINACNAAGGGTVYLSGGTFLSGSIQLKSNVTLFIDSDAVLLGSQNDSDYPTLTILSNNTNKTAWGRALIYALGADNVKIDGAGTINGNGDIEKWRFTPNDPSEYSRPVLVLIGNGTNISIRNVYITNGAVWTLVPFECTNLTIADVNINSTVEENRDGIDITDDTNVIIERCNIYTDDDALCFKSGVAAGVNNATVRYCNIGKSVRANGIKFGTNSYGGFKNIIIEDMYIKDVESCAISPETVDGAEIYNVTFRRIDVKDVGVPIYVIIGVRHTRNGQAERWGSVDTMKFESISVSNLKKPKGLYGCPISGTVYSGTTYKLYNLLFYNVDITFPGGKATMPAEPAEMGTEYPEATIWGAMPAYAYYLRHVDGVTFNKCDSFISAATDVRAWRYTNDVSNAVTTNCTTMKTLSNIATVTSSVYQIDEASKMIYGITEGTNVSGFLGAFTPATRASIKLYDETGTVIILNGNIKDQMKLTVVSEDGTAINSYLIHTNISLIPTSFITPYNIENTLTGKKISTFIKNNDSTSTQRYHLFVATCDTNGKIVGIVNNSVELSPGETVTLKSDDIILNDSKSIKIFMWNLLSDISPLTEARTVISDNQVGKTTVCELKENKKAAYTFTTDDSLYTSVQYYNEEFKRLNLRGSMAMIPGLISGSDATYGTWSGWSDIIADGHFDVTNHTLNHIAPPTITDPAVANAEINGGQALLKSKFPGQDVITEANPNVQNTDLADSVIKQNHYAARNGIQGFNSLNPSETDWYRLNWCLVNSTATPAQMNAWVDTAITNTKWMIVLMHGINGQGSGPATASDITAHFEYVASKTGTIWCGTFNEVTKYIREKQNVTVQEKRYNSSEIVLNIVHNLDKQIFTFPLTLKTQVPAEWTAVSVSQNGIIKNITSISEDSKRYVYYDAVPNAGDITLIKGID